MSAIGPPDLGLNIRLQTGRDLFAAHSLEFGHKSDSDCETQTSFPGRLFAANRAVAWTSPLRSARHGPGVPRTCPAADSFRPGPFDALPFWEPMHLAWLSSAPPRLPGRP